MSASKPPFNRSDRVVHAVQGSIGTISGLGYRPRAAKGQEGVRRYYVLWEASGCASWVDEEWLRLAETTDQQERAQGPLWAAVEVG